MARRKQRKPTKAGEGKGASIVDDPDQIPDISEGAEVHEGHPGIPIFYEETSSVEVFVPKVDGEEGIEIAEISLLNVVSNTEGNCKWSEIDENEGYKVPLQVRFLVAVERKFRIGGYQDLASEDVTVEVGTFSEEKSAHVLLSGRIDGPASAISGLVYLIKEAIFAVKARAGNGADLPGRVGISITKKAFDTCETYLANNLRSALAKALQNTMTWLRPELTADAISKFGKNGEHGNQNEDLMVDAKNTEGANVAEDLQSSSEKQQGEFDPTALYDSIRPTRKEPGLDMAFPELLPELRPYQRRAAFWMVQRERGLGAHHKSENIDSSCASTSLREFGTGTENPLWVPVISLDSKSRFYYNPYSGYVSMQPRNLQTYVHGGILADEMGLGKTVELLACILANRVSKESMTKAMDKAKQVQETLRFYKRDRIECSCGATQEDDFYQASWVQCDHCDAWQHALCVGYATPRDIDANLQRIAAQGKQVKKAAQARLGKWGRDTHTTPINILATEKPNQKGRTTYAVRSRKARDDSSVVKDGEDTFVCGTCAEMIGRVEVEGECGATLVVCPTPILRQWQDEISRHVRAGALRVMVYEGVQKGATVATGGQNESGISEVQRIKAVGAHDLATADLVLTTYDILRADMFHVASATNRIQRSFRQAKRFPVIPTPLTRLKWWRVCLDEAQMVERITARATEMAMTLRATHRWCVSGTPIQRGLDDLYGLLRFLGAQPFDDYRWWSLGLKQPYEEGKQGARAALHDFFRGVMWRSTKVQVADELDLPPQEERLGWLRFSAIEAHFYRQQHERCAVRAREVIANYRRNSSLAQSPPRKRRRGEPVEVARNSISEVSGLNSGASTVTENGKSRGHLDDLEDRPLSHKEAAKLLDHLLSLRQACVHPQVGSAGIRSLQRLPMTMDEILEVLVDKARLEAEDAQRSLIGALNGLAALALIEKNNAQAVSIYREALACTEENAEDIRVDPLQKLHTLHNLAEVLGVKCHTEEAADQERQQHASESRTGNGQASESNQEQVASTGNSLRLIVPRTLRDDLLLKQCNEIKERYLATFNAKLATIRADFHSARKQVDDIERESNTAGGNLWWMEILTALEQQPDLGKDSGKDHGMDIVRKIRDQLLESDHLGEAGNMGRVKHRNTSSIALRFRDISGLKMVLLRELGAIESGRKDLLERLTDLDAGLDNPDPFDVEHAGHCSRCQPDMKGPICAHCEAEELFQAYENRLFLLKVTAAGEEAVSAEDALIAQHASLALKRVEVNMTGVRGNQTVKEVAERTSRTKGPVSAQVTRAPSETERILTVLRGQVKFITGRDGLTAARKHLQSLEAKRKEYAQVRVLALAQREVLYALDELNMATSRLRLKYPGEDSESVVNHLLTLHPEEVPQRNALLTGEKFMARDDLRQAKGQLRYLKGLKSSRRKRVLDTEAARKTTVQDLTDSSQTNETGFTTTEGLEKAEECPVCHEKLGTQLMVLPCGHVLCCKCLLNLVDRSTMPQSQKRINCPNCRRRTNVGEIAYVDNAYERLGPDPTLRELYEGESTEEEHAFPVKGSYGTKLEAVVRRILWVKSTDPEAKVLLFSEWQGVLDVVEHALTANHITFARVKGTRQMHAAIEKFRGAQSSFSPESRVRKKAKVEDKPGPVQVLLMPIRLGANGLNLVEAQHVVLLEPLLNPAAEAQAINRVHRIGQTHTTFVHRFIISDTVEESIYGLRRDKVLNTTGVGANKPERYALTLRDLSSLFTSQTGGTIDLTQMQAAGLVGDFRSLPPAAAAAAAAEARLASARELQEK